MTVHPESSLRKVCWTFSSVVKSTEAVASSAMKTLLRRSKARAIDSLFVERSETALLMGDETHKLSLALTEVLSPSCDLHFEACDESGTILDRRVGAAGHADSPQNIEDFEV